MIQILMSSRRTIMSGEVVTFATKFESISTAFGTAYDAKGPFEVSASRDAVMVHRAECRFIEEMDVLTRALVQAKIAWARLGSYRGGGAPSLFPSEPAVCEEHI